MPRTFEATLQACEIVGSKGERKDVEEIRVECMGELRELFQKGVLTEPEHDACLNALFGQVRKPVQTFRPEAIGDNFPVFKIPFPAHEPEPPKAA